MNNRRISIALKQCCILALFLVANISYCSEGLYQAIELDSIKQAFRQAQTEHQKKSIVDNYLLRAESYQDSSYLIEALMLKGQLGRFSLKNLNSALRAITIAKNIQSKELELRAYRIVAFMYYFDSNFKESLVYLDKAILTNEALNDKYWEMKNQHLKSILLNNCQDNEKALILLENNSQFFSSSQTRTKFPSEYLSHIYALGDAYIRNQKAFKAVALIDSFINENSELEQRYLNNALMIKGNALFHLANYEESVKILKSLCPKFKKPSYEHADCITNMVESLKKLKKDAEILESLNKFLITYGGDTRYQEYQSFVYLELSELYSRRNDNIKESMFLKKHVQIKRNIENKPLELKNEFSKIHTRNLKERLSAYALKNMVSIKWLRILSILIILAIILVVSLFLRNRIMHLRLEKLILDLEKDENSKNEKSPLLSLNLHNNSSSEILEKLASFEANKKYLKNNYTLSVLARELNTNTSYLSRVINQDIGKTFTNYINDLRIEHIIQELYSNEETRLYSFEGIAQSIGFKNSKSFSRAFKRKTGLSPSLYLKKLTSYNDI